MTEPSVQRPPRTQPENVRLRAVVPSLVVADLAASLRWYREVIGFIVAEDIVHDGRQVGAWIKAGAVEFLLTQDDFARGRDRVKGEGFRLYCITNQDIDRLAEGIRSRGGTLAQEPTTQPWGARDIAVIDPDGFRISLAAWIR